MASLRYIVCLIIPIAISGCIPSPEQKEVKTDNGIRIVFLSDRSGNFDLWSLDTEGGQLKQLTENPDWDWSPKFHVAMGRITYHSNRADTFAIFSMSPNGEGKQKAEIQKTENYSLAPDGSKILYVQGEGTEREIYLSDPDGSNPVNLSNYPAYDGRPNFSPDGKMIAFISERDGDPELFIINADGTGLRQLTANSAREKYHSWRYDGKAIYVTSSLDSANSEIYEVFLDGTPMKQLTDNDYSEAEICASPWDGRIVYHGEGTMKDQIYLFDPENWSHTKLTKGDNYNGEPVWVRLAQ